MEIPFSSIGDEMLRSYEFLLEGVFVTKKKLFNSKL